MDAETHELIAGYALDALDEGDRARAKELLASSEEAREELRSLTEVAAAMATATVGPHSLDRPARPDPRRREGRAAERRLARGAAPVAAPARSRDRGSGRRVRRAGARPVGRVRLLRPRRRTLRARAGAGCGCRSRPADVGGVADGCARPARRGRGRPGGARRLRRPARTGRQDVPGLGDRRRAPGLRRPLRAGHRHAGDSRRRQRRERLGRGGHGRGRRRRIRADREARDRVGARFASPEPARSRHRFSPTPPVHSFG